MNIQKKMLNTAEFLGLCVAVNIQRTSGDPINQTYYVEGIQTGIAVNKELLSLLPKLSLLVFNPERPVNPVFRILIFSCFFGFLFLFFNFSFVSPC